MVNAQDARSGSDDEVTRQVVVAVRDDLVRFSVERVLQTMQNARLRSSATWSGEHAWLEEDTELLIIPLSEIDESTVPLLRRAGERGARIWLLLRPGDSADPSRLAGIEVAGMLMLNTMDQTVLRDMLSAMVGAGSQRPVETPVRKRSRITPREREVLNLMVEGLSNRQIASHLSISENGAKRLVTNILCKLDCPNRTRAVAKALSDGLCESVAKAL